MKKNQKKAANSCEQYENLSEDEKQMLIGHKSHL